jgi:hypothetical protein
MRSYHFPMARPIILAILALSAADCKGDTPVPKSPEVCGVPLDERLAPDYQLILQKFPGGVQCYAPGRAPFKVPDGSRAASRKVGDQWVIAFENHADWDSPTMQMAIIQHEFLHGWLWTQQSEAKLSLQQLGLTHGSGVDDNFSRHFQMYASHRSIAAEEERFGLSEPLLARADWNRDKAELMGQPIQDHLTYFFALLLLDLRWRDPSVAKEASQSITPPGAAKQINSLADDLEQLWNKERPDNDEHLKQAVRRALNILHQYPLTVRFQIIPSAPATK